MVSLDEALFYLIKGMHETKICYVPRKQRTPEDWIREFNEVNAPKIMVVAGMTGRGPLKARIVPVSVKINSLFYVENVLTPIINEELPNLYPGELNKVFLHHDKASSHVSKMTTAYLSSMEEETGITFIHKEDTSEGCRL